MKKAVFILIVLLFLTIINSLVHSIVDLWNKKDLLTSAQKSLSEEKKRNQKLKAELSYVETQAFVDETARNKLFLAKPGEQQVLIPNEPVSSQKKEQKQVPNWQKWLNLFF